MRSYTGIQPKPKLILISPTAGTLEQFEKSGFLSRQAALIREYSRHFDVEYYTADTKDYSHFLGVRHHPLPVRLDVYGLRHLLFWIFLVAKAPFMRGVIRTFGVEIPTLPFVKLLSGQKVVAGFQWDYALQTRANYKGLKRWLAQFLQDSGFKGADMVICTTGWLKETAEKKYGKKTAVFPNFVDPSVFHKAAVKEDTIIYAGRLHWSKGIEYLIAAFKSVLSRFPSYRLLICGNGESEGALKEMVSREGITNVDFLGVVQQDRLAGHLARAKVFVLPTITYEGHPKILIEAMASGTACVATSVPGNKDVITDRVSGYLVEPKDPEGLAAALLYILGDESFRNRLEAAAYEQAQRFSLKSVLDQEASLIRTLISG